MEVESADGSRSIRAEEEEEAEVDDHEEDEDVNENTERSGVRVGATINVNISVDASETKKTKPKKGKKTKKKTGENEAQKEEPCLNFLDKFLWKIPLHHTYLGIRQDVTLDRDLKSDEKTSGQSVISNLNSSEYDYEERLKLSESMFVLGEKGLCKIIQKSDDKMIIQIVREEEIKKEEETKTTEEKPKESVKVEVKVNAPPNTSAFQPDDMSEEAMIARAIEESMKVNVAVEVPAVVEVSTTVPVAEEKAEKEATKEQQSEEKKEEEGEKKEEETDEQREKREEEERNAKGEFTIAKDNFTTYKNYVTFNARVVSGVRQLLLEEIEILFSDEVKKLPKLVAELLNVSPKLFQVFYKEKEITESEERIHTLLRSNNEEIIFYVKESKLSEIMKRSSSKDYSMSDRKHVSVIGVDYPIVVDGVGFMRCYGDNEIEYELKVVQQDRVGKKVDLISQAGIKVLNDDVDASTFVKLVTVESFKMFPGFKYFFFVSVTSTNCSTYYFSSGDSQTEKGGVKFKFFSDSVSGYRSSTTNGHIPWISFKLAGIDQA